MTRPQQEGWLVGNDLGTNSELLNLNQQRFRRSGRVGLLSLDQHFSPPSELLRVSKSSLVCSPTLILFSISAYSLDFP